jgi:hypothetical protein
VITEEDLHRAAEVVATSDGPEDLGIDARAIQEFVTSSEFKFGDGVEVYADFPSIAYGIAVGVIAGSEVRVP